MANEGFTNDPYAWLPAALRPSRFIREGHNTSREEVKNAKSALKAAKKGVRIEKKTAKQDAYNAEHPLYAARHSGPDAPGMAGARREAIAAAKLDPNARRNEVAARKSARRGKKVAKLQKKLDKFSA